MAYVIVLHSCIYCLFTVYKDCVKICGDYVSVDKKNRKQCHKISTAPPRVGIGDNENFVMIYHESIYHNDIILPQHRLTLPQVIKL